MQNAMFSLCEGKLGFSHRQGGVRYFDASDAASSVCEPLISIQGTWTVWSPHIEACCRDVSLNKATLHLPLSKGGVNHEQESENSVPELFATN